MAELIRTFRLLNAEQRAAAVGAVLLAVSTFGPFSFVEAAELLIAFGVLALLWARAHGKRFHLPFGDGTAIAGARERAKRPADDLPEEHRTPPIRREPAERRRRRRRAEPPAPPASRGASAEEETEPLPPPEFEPYRPAAGEQLHLGGDEPERQRPGDA